MSTNTTGLCSNYPNSLTSPITWGNNTAYVVTGPISNFTEAVTSCCPPNGTVSNYPGGPEPLACYYMCAFNGTVGDMREAMACNRGAAEERRRAGVGPAEGAGGMGYHPDLASEGGAGRLGVVGGSLGAWKCVMLVLGVVGSTVGLI